MSRILMAVVVVLTVAAALAVNAMLVGLQTRPAVARSGGSLMETAVVTANVKIEGRGAADRSDPRLRRGARLVGCDCAGSCRPIIGSSVST